jgi:DNA-nicking Smr family endonuclease
MPTILTIVIFAAIAFLIGWLVEYLSFSSHHRNENNSAKYEVYDHRLQLSNLDEAEAYRKTATTHAENRMRLITSSQEAFKKNDKKGAKEFSDEAKREGIMMNQCNEQAAENYFKHNNSMGMSNFKGEVDLHGLHVDEALLKVEESIQRKLKESIDSIDHDKKHVIFIVGMGNHSVGGLRKIKPAMEEMINRKYGFLCVPDKPHKGCVWVEVINANSQQTNQKEKSFCIIS